MKNLALLFLALTVGCTAQVHREEVVLPLVPVVLVDNSSVPGCTVIRAAKDSNRNGLWDLSDVEQQQSMVCDGADGQDGTSCSVAPEMSDSVQIGSRIYCTDGSWTVVLNGAKGATGNTGATGANGQDGQSCVATTVPAIPFLAPHGGVAITCPGQLPRIVHNGRDGQDGEDGEDGRDGASIGMTSSSASSSQCPTGGSVLSFYKDNNNNGSKQSSEPIVNTTVICNGAKGATGSNGSNGSNGTSSSVATQTLSSGNANCPAGGLAITITNGSSSSTKYVCNGAQGATGQNGSNGTDGEDGEDGLSAYEIAVENGYTGSEAQWLATLVGPQGDVGAQGPAGPMANVTTANGFTPYKLCPADNSAFPEYGFIVGNQIYAVYYGVIGGSQQAFLAKLNDGNYVTTNGASCSFSVSHNSNGDLLINNSVVVTSVNLAAGLIVFNSELERNQATNNNASVKIRLKNVSNLTLSKFKVTVSGLSSGVLRAGSSLNSPGGHMDSYTNYTATFLVTNSGAIPPNSFVDLTLRITSLGSESLSYTVEAL